MNFKKFQIAPTLLLVTSLIILSATMVRAHCDTMNGPVVKDAKLALAKGDVTAALKWVKKEYEEQIRVAFKNTMIVRAKSPEGKELADMYFFETLVRLHRAGEGAPYTGLKPAETFVEASVAAADEALEQGSVDKLAKLVSHKVANGIRAFFEHATMKKKEADRSIEAGREYVEAYVAFVHYVERLDIAAQNASVHHNEEGGESPHKH